MLKIDFHTHTKYSVNDLLRHSPKDIVDRALALGFDALAITDHDTGRGYYSVRDYARKKGLLLVPGIELTLSGKHVLALNAGEGLMNSNGGHGLTLDNLESIKDENEGVFLVAVHPWFPLGHCLKSLVFNYIRFFDAIELNSYYSRHVDFNKKAFEAARRFGKPLVGFSDAHFLDDFGAIYTLVDADRSVDSILDALRVGRARVVTSPMTSFDLTWKVARFAFMNVYGFIRPNNGDGKYFNTPHQKLFNKSKHYNV